MFKKSVLSLLVLVSFVIGGNSIRADESYYVNNGICKDIQKNVEENKYVKSCFKVFPVSPLGPSLKIPNDFLYDDGIFKGILYLTHKEYSKHSVVSYYEGVLNKYK